MAGSNSQHDMMMANGQGSQGYAVQSNTGAAGASREGKRGQAQQKKDDVNMMMQEQYDQLPDNCSNAKYLDIEATKLMGSGSFGKYSIMLGLNRSQMTGFECLVPFGLAKF